MKTNLEYGLLLLFLWGCNNTEMSNNNPISSPKEATSVAFQLNLIRESASTRALPPITSAAEKDSLVKSMRVFVFNSSSNICEAYADFSPLKLSETDTIRLTVMSGTKDFVFLTNASDTLVSTKNPIGKTRQEILINLEKYTSDGRYLPARQYFWGEVKNIAVAPNTFPSHPVSLVRMVGQVETSLHINQVWQLNANHQPVSRIAPGYIRNVNSLVLKYIPTIILLDKHIVINSSTINTAAAVIVNNSWTLQNNDTIALNKTLSFTSQGITAKPFLFIAAEVNPLHSAFVSDPRDLVMPNGNVIRYWWLQLTNHDILPNKRLILNIQRMLGTGAVIPPTPTPNASLHFTITVLDWDTPSDEATGGNDDFLP